MKRTIFFLMFAFLTVARSADSADVTFRYTISGHSGISVPGTFNAWNNAAWPMTSSGGNLYIRQARLAVGMYQYKFYYSGVAQWPNDPLNHHVNVSDNSNSVLYVRDPTIYHFVPNDRSAVIGTTTPVISAYLYPKVGSVVDTTTLSLIIDGATYSHIGGNYDFITMQLSFLCPPLPNGSHTVILSAGSSLDTVTFTTQGGFVRLLNQFPFTTIKSSWTLNGTVDDSTVSSVRIVRNGVDTFAAAVANKAFTYNMALAEGANVLVAIADSAGSTKISSPATFTRRISHNPVGVISISQSGSNLIASADLSTDPDPGQSSSLSFLWSEDSTNPVLFNINNTTNRSFTIAQPGNRGEYYFNLICNDVDGNRDTTRNYFTITKAGGVVFSRISNTPDWAQKARVYFLFPKAASSAGTINAAAQKLSYIKDLGFSVIWLMPVMKNAFPIDNNFGSGYNIVDFYTVAPEYGTNQDLRNFVDEAHTLGLKVILDITPNHTSRFHPWSQSAHTYATNSPYWNWYQHAFIPHNDNGLGQTMDSDNFWYYSAFSDQLLNINWTDADAQAEMIDVYKYWIREFGVDGYRFDVYWGPHRRYGEQYMGKPVRDALKHIKPDILLLAEDDGTGGGTEVIFADRITNGINGGVDAAYDFKLYQNQIQHFGFSGVTINNLHTEIDNAGFYPGGNSLYMRFMESQDEDRIVYFYSNGFALDAMTTFKRTMPMASVVFASPGFPMLWNGQEVGWGYGISGAKEARSRSVINWNYQGRPLLTPHYQKLAHIRAQFPAFTQHRRDTNLDGLVNASDSSDFVRIPSSNSLAYAFTRPYVDQNGLSVVNFSPSSQTTVLNLTGGGALKFTRSIFPRSGFSYYLNNLYDNSSQSIDSLRLDSLVLTLPPFGSALFTVSTTQDSVTILNPILSVHEEKQLPLKFELAQNYPNPFNPTTTIEFSIPKSSFVRLTIYNTLGQEVSILADGFLQAGHYTESWDARMLASGVYFYRLETPAATSTRKMLLIR